LITYLYGHPFQADKLRYHCVLHTAEKSFHCDQCDKSFPRVDKLNRRKVSIGSFCFMSA
jgi:hypothetical protein